MSRNKHVGLGKGKADALKNESGLKEGLTTDRTNNFAEGQLWGKKCQ